MREWRRMGASGVCHAAPRRRLVFSIAGVSHRRRRRRRYIVWHDARAASAFVADRAAAEKMKLIFQSDNPHVRLCVCENGKSGRQAVVKMRPPAPDHLTRRANFNAQMDTT